MPLFDLGGGRTVEVDVIEIFPDMQIGHKYEQEREDTILHTSYHRKEGDKLIVQCRSRESLRPEVLEHRQEVWRQGAIQMVQHIQQDIALGKRTLEEVEAGQAAAQAKWQLLGREGEIPAFSQ